jgi:hypothetical protein
MKKYLPNYHINLVDVRRLLCDESDAEIRDIPSQCRPALPQPVDRL